MDRVGGIGEGVFVLDSNSISRSEIPINLLRAIWEGVSAILTFARDEEDLAVSSGVDGSTDMPRTKAGGIDNLLLSHPMDI